MTANVFANGLDHPRWLYVLPNGDVPVAEANAPPQPVDSTGIKSRVMRLLMKQAGAATPSANRIPLIRDADGDGVADLRSAFLEALHSPFGMVLVSSDLYGWPYSYYGQHVDSRVTPQRPDLVATAIAPDYALGAHTASLGLAQSTHNALPARFQQGMFIGQHGSWQRRPRSGYKVHFGRFVDGRPTGMPLDVLTGFVDAAGNARGRPVGVAIDTKGNLLVADDVGNTVWRVTSAVPAR
jgi:glucose/arabinose dehydrogenase